MRRFEKFLNTQGARERKTAPLLVVSRNATLVDRLRRTAGIARRMVGARSSDQAIRKVSGSRWAAAVVDLRFADSKMDGLELALNLRDRDSSLPVWLADLEGGNFGKSRGRGPAAIAVEDAVRELCSRHKSHTGLQGLLKRARFHRDKGGMSHG